MRGGRVSVSNLGLLLLLFAQNSPVSSQETISPPQTSADHYTRYELLGPESASFRILYEVSATTPGATTFLNPIRPGSEARDEAIFDRMTGEALPFEIVDGAAARELGLSEAAVDTRFIKVSLSRAVPEGGEVRILIDKTYRDPKSYFVRGDHIVFERSLGIRRNAIVLPKGYEVVACNTPVQVRTEADGRIVVSFMATGPGATAFRVEARRVAQ